MRNILFICSRNQWRSPTGEQVWKHHPALNVRSAGTSQKAKKTVKVHDIQWAEIIFVMEEKHKRRLKSQFTRVTTHKDIRVLDVPDEYQFMDHALIQIFKEVVGMHLGISWDFRI
ncbi:phosphotyrosine protein phosphatase [Pseudoalteromonas sp. SMS1]|uniref:low molecular weight protein tyrosine phosphatase family protein n=1 Tax=Pseudoalteromonas sp. SMS1 TaxID=2908894 RepID=UPI001F2B4686|nr:phosphotyrosine protein phosphatase [Pseudoalteromonas sp. SMS1]MCF2856671.1 phosphotyrosine protein phosphatase [Pseudoalteromonas sp. SMS1]